jgi:uncharacterized Zn finger protein (UPF0148 family)
MKENKNRCPRCKSKKEPLPRLDGSKFCDNCGQRWIGNNLMPSYDRRQLVKENKMAELTATVKEPKAPKNIDVEVKGTKMTITIDTSKDFGPSKSGKTTMIATTSGEVKIGDVCVNINVYKKA